MRLFVAINFPEALRRRVHADVAPLRDATDAVSWVPEERLHLTLKFLGEQEESLVEPLAGMLGAVARRYAPFGVALGEVGAFPGLRRPRVVWLGAHTDGPLAALARDVDRGAASLGVPAERRPYCAHLTLGRARRPLRPEEAERLAAAAAASRGRYESTVGGLELMHSELSPRGARYRVLAAVPLGAA